MDALERFERTAAVARRDRAPAIDVAGRVLAVLHRQPACVERYTDNQVALAVWAAVSVLAASLLAPIALEAWSTISDPVSVLFQSLSVVMQ